MTSRNTTALLVILLATAVAGAILVYIFERDTDSHQNTRGDSQQTPSQASMGDAEATSFDTSAEVAALFTGSEKCMECHAEQGADYRKSGHSRTIRRAGEWPLMDRMKDMSFHDTVRNADFLYHVDGDMLDVSLPKVFGQKRLPLDFAFGSGDHAVTFMSLIDDGQGNTLGLEHRVSWYERGDRFDYTPRHDELDVVRPVEHFGRIVPAEKIGGCFACHTTTSAIEGTNVVRLMENVGCESCHGPGTSHLQAVDDGLEDLAIGFQTGKWTGADELRVCGRCHRSASDIPSQVIRTDEQRIIRFQPVGLVQSACFLKSSSLSCSTCHNPHQPVRQTPKAAYQQKCINCHGIDDKQTQCPVSPNDRCISCHMPPIETHPGILFHDHWIRVRDQSETPAENGKRNGFSGEIP